MNILTRVRNEIRLLMDHALENSISIALFDSVFRMAGKDAFVAFFRKNSDYFFSCWKQLQAKIHASETLKDVEWALFILDALMEILVLDFEMEWKNGILVKEFLSSFKQATYLMTVLLDLTLKRHFNVLVHLLDQLMIQSESHYNDKLIDSLSSVLNPLTEEDVNDFFIVIFYSFTIELLPPSIFKQIVIEDRLLQICFIHRSNKKLLPMPFSVQKLIQVYMDPSAMKNNFKDYWTLIVAAIATEIHLGQITMQEKNELKEALEKITGKHEMTDIQPLMDIVHELLSL